MVSYNTRGMHRVDSQSKWARSMGCVGITAGVFLNVSPDILALSPDPDELRRIAAGGGAIDCLEGMAGIELRFGPIGVM